MTRRTFAKQSTAFAAALPFMTALPTKSWFSISLAEWSLHRSIFGGKIDPLDFPVIAKQKFGIDAVEYVNSFFLPSGDFVAELKRRAEGEGVTNLLIMVDEAGRLGDINPALRADAVDRHTLWLDFAHQLECKSIRINARSEGTSEEQMKRMADGLRQLASRASERDLNIVVENHGGYSSHGDWVAGLMRMIDLPNVGTLPDFGNWYPADEYGGPPRQPGQKAETYYDRYKGVDEMMPFAKGVSAKSYAFDADGNETSTNYKQMMKLVKRHNFNGHVGIEYEGTGLSEEDGIMATKQLLEKIRIELGG